MNIICMRTDRLGETLLTLPAIKVIRDKIGGARISLFAQQFMRPLCEHLYYIDSFYDFPSHGATSIPIFSSKFIRTTVLMKKLSADAVVCFNPRKDLHLLSFLSGAPIRIGYDRKWGFLLNRTISDNKQRGFPEVVYNLELASLLIEKQYPSDVSLFNFFKGFPVDVGVDALRKIGINSSKKYIIAHIFSSDERKLWPYELWHQFFTTINEDVILIGDSSERGIAEEFFGEFNNIHIAVGMWDIYELGCVMSNFGQAFIGLDSGPMHLAYMCGLKVFILWGYADVKRWGPPEGYGNMVVKDKDIKTLSLDFVLTKFREFSC